MNQTARTTVAIPVDLLRYMDEAVRAGHSVSRNQFLAVAIRKELERMQREAIDTEFEGMADDELYQNESSRISTEYAQADWEALRVAESDS